MNLIKTKDIIANKWKWAIFSLYFEIININLFIKKKNSKELGNVQLLLFGKK
jgi:hypothetical protein